MNGSNLPDRPSDSDREEIAPAVPDNPKNVHAVALGRLGGLKGGRVTADRMTPEERRERALKAARARWGKKKRKKPK